MLDAVPRLETPGTRLDNLPRLNIGYQAADRYRFVAPCYATARSRAAAVDAGPRLGYGWTRGYSSMPGTGPWLYTGPRLYMPWLEISCHG